MIYTILFFATTVHAVFDHFRCSISSNDEIQIGSIPTTFEFNVPYTVILSSNQSRLLSHVTLNVDSLLMEISNDSTCQSINKTLSSYQYKTEIILKFERNITKSECLRLKLQNLQSKTDWDIVNLCSNSSSDKLIDNDDKYDVQNYMRTINTIDVAVLDNFNWLIFGSPTQQIWHTHEGMRLSRECDAAEDGRVAIFSNPRGKRRLISRPIQIFNVSYLYMRIGSGTCPPPAPMDPPLQIFFTIDCTNYTNWRLMHSQKILPNIEDVTVPLSSKNLSSITSKSICLKIEQTGDRFAGGGSWFIDDFFMIRSRDSDHVFYDSFETMRPAKWQRLAGGHWKSCNERLSMVFENNPDIRTEIGATTIDFALSESIDDDEDILFHISKRRPIDWTKWNATGFVNLNSTCNEEDLITFNGDNYRQLCSPIIELGRLDSIRFTLSTEPCAKKSKQISNPDAMIFLSILYEGATVGYSRNIRRIALKDIQTTKTFNIRMSDVRHRAQTFGQICLSQYHQSTGNNVDMWSIRDFYALPQFPSNITHYIQLQMNTKCSALPTTNGPTHSNIQIEYSLDFGKNWHGLLQTCYLDSSCSRDVQHVYSSQIVLPLSDWHRVTLPLPFAVLQQDFIRFRISAPAGSMSIYSNNDAWAIEKVFIGRCHQACSGHGSCEWNSCRCDPGYEGDFCEMSNTTLIQRAAYLFEQQIENKTDLIYYQGGRFNYKCNIISQGKALVFSKTGHRFLRLSKINGSEPKLLEFTLRLGSANQQCYGTSPNDIARDLKSVLLLTSCSNGVHWTIVDGFRITDLLAPDYGTLSRIIFQEKTENDECLIEWRQMTHGGDNQDVWAIDDIIIREIPSIKKPSRTKSFQSKSTYIRPGFVLSFQVDSVNTKDAKTLLDFDDFRLRINSTQLDLNRQSDVFSYQLENSTRIVIVPLPKSIWFTTVMINLTVIPTKKYDLTNVHLGVRCENDCWLNGPCLEGICLSSTNQSVDGSTGIALDENDIRQIRINVIDDELLLPLIDATKLTDIHFQTLITTVTKNQLVFECSPNAGTKWFELAQWSGEKDKTLKDHYVSLPNVCQAKRTLFRWKTNAIKLINVAFVRFQSRNYFIDQFETIDMTKWLYPNFHVNTSRLYPNKIVNHYQLMSTKISLKPHDYVLMIDIDPKVNNTEIDVDYSLDNTTWISLLTEREPKSPKHRFGNSIPKELLGRSILIRLNSPKPFILQHIYLGPSCPANCYGQGKCLWIKQALCECDQNQTRSDTHCLAKEILLPSLHETFEQPFNKSIWSISSQGQFTRQCYNRLSKTTPYLCFLPHNQTQSAYAIVGPFQPIKYVSFKFGLQFVNQGNNCSTYILFQYSYDRGIQWFTKEILDETRSIFTTFDDLKINTNLYLRWIEGTDRSCIMWNLRAVTIRTKSDNQIWFDSNLDLQPKTKIIYELQTWEYASLPTSSLIQFELQMFPIKSSNQTNWLLNLEISTDIQDGWSSWTPLIPSCNQSDLYCEDNIALTGSSFLMSFYHQIKNITLPIPDIYALQDVRFRWIASEPDARFLVKSLYVGADCPWFCSGHGICLKNGCLCDVGYVLPFCSPDPSMKVQRKNPSNEIDANLTRWSYAWGYEKCSNKDERMTFSLAGTRGLISPELSLTGMKYLRIELDSCMNRSDSFADSILVQYSLNNGLLWSTLTRIIYHSNKVWLITLPMDEAMQLHLVRLRLFQRVETKWASSWLLNRFEIIPEKLPQQWINTNTSIVTRCYLNDGRNPIEIYSTVDMNLTETSFLTFQLDRNTCSKNTSKVLAKDSPWDLEYSIDYGQTWASIDRPSTPTSNPIDIIIRQPLQSISNDTFGLSLYAYLPLAKFLRIRWLAPNSTIANLWRIKDVTIRHECDVICRIDPCQSKCSCPKTNSCALVTSKKRTFVQNFDQNSSSIPEIIVLPPLSLILTRFLEFRVQSHCEQNHSLSLSIEYSRNLGLTWQLFHYYVFYINRSNSIHEELFDVMHDDSLLIRFVFLQPPPSCWKIEQILISGSTVMQNMIYVRFDQFNPFESNLFLSLGETFYNSTHLIYSTFNQSNSTVHDLITDELFVSNPVVYVQFALFPLSTNFCLKIDIDFSSNYGHTWIQIEHDNQNHLFEEQHLKKQQILTWKLTSLMLGANQGRFRFRFDINTPTKNRSETLFALSEFYFGGTCINGCSGHGMCTNTRQCRCDPGWTNKGCSLRLMSFPNEIDLLDQKHFTSSGATKDNRCGFVFNHTCRRVLETKFLDINHEKSYVHLELDDLCLTNTTVRRNGDGWIRLQYREMNTYPWINLYIFKGYTLKITQLLPPIILQLRLIQDTPMIDRSPWSIEQFYVFHIHPNLQWSLTNRTVDQKSQNSTFLTSTKSYQTKDVSFQLNSILQFETNCSDSTDEILRYSSDLGSTWFTIANDQQLSFVPIRFDRHFYRYTLPFNSFLFRNDSIRFEITLNSSCQLQYLYVGDSCPMNCYGQARCSQAQCFTSVAVAPLGEFRETEETHWLQFDAHRQAMTQPIDLRPLKALKWTYLFDKISKSCTTSIYLMISTDGTLTWSILHRFDVSVKTNSSVELSIELHVNNTKNYLSQFRWYQPISTTCPSFTWNVSRIISVKTINIYFFSDYFYTISSSRSNWESIEGARLAQADQCNSNVPSLIFDKKTFSVVTVPILVQSHYVLVFQFSTKCKQTAALNSMECENLTSTIEYRTESLSTWIKLADMDEIACRTSLINGGYFNQHMMKLPVEAHSSGTQFRWTGTQAEKAKWSMHGLFIGECPDYCHDRGLCTISGCQCTINYAGPSCEKYVGKEPLSTTFYETFDELSAMNTDGSQSNNWMKLTGNGHIRHVCDDNSDSNSTNKYLSGQALHFGAGCGCAHVEAITRELNVTQVTTMSFAFHVTAEDNCLPVIHNITVALEWTRDEGMSWWRLVTMYNQEHPQFFNITLPTEMIQNGKQTGKHHIGGIRFRWTQIDTAPKEVFWSIDNIRLE